MTAEQRQSLQVILMAVYVKGILHEPIDINAFISASIDEIMQVLLTNEKE